MKSGRISGALLVAGLVCWATILAPAQQYNMTVLAPYGPMPSTGLNNLGEVVGHNDTWNTAFRYSNGVLGSLGLGYSAGTATNNRSQVVMYSSTAYHSYLLSPPNVYLVDLGSLGGGGYLNNGGYTGAEAMNDNGAVVGESNLNSTVLHGFVYANGHMTDLGSFGRGLDSGARGINNLGQIVGKAVNSGGYTRAVIMANGTVTDLDPSNPTYDSYANSINDAGQIVVDTNEAWCMHIALNGKKYYVACRGAFWHSVIYNAGTLTSVSGLGSLDTLGGGMNRYGDVVGMSYTVPNIQHAFLYRAGVTIDLNYHVNNIGSWVLWSGSNINDSGQIVCLARGPDGLYYVVLLNPDNSHPV